MPALGVLSLEVPSLEVGRSRSRPRLCHCRVRRWRFRHVWTIGTTPTNCYRRRATMAKARGDFLDTAILRPSDSQRPDQLEEARAYGPCRPTPKIQDTLDKLGYATKEQVMSRHRRILHGMQFIDLTDVTIPPAIIELVPESVARKTSCCPSPRKMAHQKIILSDSRRLRDTAKIAVHPPERSATGPRLARTDRRGHQPPLRPDRNRVRRLDAPGLHRHRHRLHRDGTDLVRASMRKRTTRPRS